MCVALASDRGTPSGSESVAPICQVNRAHVLTRRYGQEMISVHPLASSVRRASIDPGIGADAAQGRSLLAGILVAGTKICKRDDADPVYKVNGRDLLKPRGRQ